MILRSESDIAASPAVDEEREIVAGRLIGAPPERVFEAWIDRAQVARWWGPDGFTNTIHAMDARPGGAFRLTMHGPDGGEYPNEFIFREVVPAQRIVLSHTSGHRFDLIATFAGEGGRTRLTARMRFDTAAERDEKAEAGAAAGLNQTVDRLGEHVAGSTVPSERPPLAKQ